MHRPLCMSWILLASHQRAARSAPAALPILLAGALFAGCSNSETRPLIDDLIPPAAVMDLEARPTPPISSSVQLIWTAPGDDGEEGTASHHDIRYSTSPLDDSMWDEAIPVPSPPSPREGGSTEYYTVTDLQSDTVYYFGLRASDESQNWSLLSNVEVVWTDAPSGFRRLTDSPDTETGCDWSPDGSRVVFSAVHGESFSDDLWLVSWRDRAAVQLTNTPERETRPRWSPDGTRIAFEVLEATALGIFTISPTGGGLNVLVLSQGDDGTPAWSHDGRQVAFFSDRSGNPDIWVISAEGGEPTQITSDGATDFGPSWSPDGSEIAFASNRSGNFDIWVARLSGGDPWQLTTDPAQDLEPCWGPGIAFTSDRSGNFDVWMFIFTGPGPISVTSDPAEDTSPSWSPEGELVFLSDREGQRDLWITRPFRQLP